MHGLVLHELRRFVDDASGNGAWPRAAAGLDHLAVPEPRAVYPDGDVIVLLRRLSEELGRDEQDLLEAFGAALAPALVAGWAELVDPAWSALDLIERTEEIIHRAVRRDRPGADPPALLVQRRGADEVVVFYGSARRMCGLARGIVRGIGTHLGEMLEIEDRRCALRGDSVCELVVRRAG